MGQLAWATDIHLDHVDNAGLIAFAEALVQDEPEGVVITGDISESTQLVYHLSAVERVVQRPVYFVLGNHDFWGSSMDRVRDTVKRVCGNSQFLRHLPMLSYVPVSKTTALVGHECWYDAREGDPYGSTFMMNDWFFTEDFINESGGRAFMVKNGRLKNMSQLIEKCQKLSHAGVLHIRNGIAAAIKAKHTRIVVATHFPPFRESHVYNGKVGDDGAQPWYTNKQLGDVMLNAARSYPNVSFTVLAGHTHGAYVGNHAQNLEVRVGHADYGKPMKAGLISV